MLLHVATNIAPDLASRSGDVADQLLPELGDTGFTGWLKTALRSVHVVHFYFSCLSNYDLVANRRVEFGLGTVLYSAAGDNAILREIARFTAAVKVFTQCMKDGRKVAKAATKLTRVVKGTYPISARYAAE